MKNEVIKKQDHAVVFIKTREGDAQVLVDIETLETMQEYDRWVIFRDRKLTPRIRSGKDSGQKFLHKILVPHLPSRATVDFKNGNPLDLRKSNLIIRYAHGATEDAFPVKKVVEVTENLEKPKITKRRFINDITRNEHLVRQSMQQAASVKAQMEAEEVSGNKEPTRRYKGVYWHKSSNRWHAAVYWKGKRHSVGYFPKDEYEKAVRAAEQYRKFGPYNTNIPGEEK